MTSGRPHPFGDAFAPAAVAPETAAFNERAAAMMQLIPGVWDAAVASVRSAGLMPQAPPSPRAIDRKMPGQLGLHIIPAHTPRGVYLHLHGGGFVLGSAAGQDPMLERICQRVGLTCVSVEYRLAPEHPYPAAWDDCESAAMWLVRHAKGELGSDTLLIGGESAGALLAVPTLIRLRDRHGFTGFRGANLSFGPYDSGMTPSQRNARSGINNASDIARCTAAYCPDIWRIRNPEVSPLYADLHGLPNALFTVGTLDAFLDDSMFMYCRWLSAGNAAEIAIWPGAGHAFTETSHPLAEAANARIDGFLDGCLRGIPT